MIDQAVKATRTAHIRLENKENFEKLYDKGFLVTDENGYYTNEHVRDAWELYKKACEVKDVKIMELEDRLANANSKMNHYHKENIELIAKLPDSDRVKELEDVLGFVLEWQEHTGLINESFSTYCDNGIFHCPKCAIHFTLKTQGAKNENE